ncbi:PREDICTED: cytochrome [Prunus dulcis]|uniref:PREDICTED: cytochrome n=1 Tax=Prunus dulcis TaxID=3755 RepID=A0A5E4F3X6_PRUDU|nr:PREDICTED: cytochrome [Prunus dulcis]
MTSHSLTVPKSTIYEKLLYNYKDISTAPYGEYWRLMKNICVLNLLSSKRLVVGRWLRSFWRSSQSYWDAVCALGTISHPLLWLTRVNGLDAKLDKVAKQFDDFLDAVVQEYMDRCSESGNDGGQVRIENEEQKDLVDVLLDIQKENLVGLPIDRDMLTVGTDSTHTILEWVMTELLRHPRIMNKL